METYVATFTIHITLTGELPIEAENGEHAEELAKSIANDLNVDVPVGWHAFINPKYDIDWDEDDLTIVMQDIT